MLSWGESGQHCIVISRVAEVSVESKSSCVRCKDEIELILVLGSWKVRNWPVGLILYRFVVDQAIKMLQKCQMDAGNFLSPEHLLMGEMEDHLAQVYATLGMALSSH